MSGWLADDSHPLSPSRSEIDPETVVPSRESSGGVAVDLWRIMEEKGLRVDDKQKEPTN